MDQGRILEDTTPQAFFTAPAHPRAQRFLSDVLRTDEMPGAIVPGAQMAPLNHAARCAA